MFFPNQNHMQPSNTYHNSRTAYGGILQPLVDSLERGTREAGRLAGKDVVLNDRSDIQAIVALDESENIHLLITPAAKDDSRLSKLDLRGMKISDTEWSVSERPTQLYLDISCTTGTIPLFKRPFLRFVEDVLFELSQSQISPSDAVYKTSLRWKKFWSTDTEGEITGEWVRGLFGELLFLSELIEKLGPRVIDNWEGPLKKDHDFQTGTDMAVEVKTSVDIPFRINCNIHQLDPDLFKKLYIVCYRITTSENGTTLPELVNNITQLVENDETQLEKFYDKLAAAGYKLHEEPLYNAFRYNHSQAAVFRVDQDFPKIVEKSFISPPDNRISSIKYILELSGLIGITLDSISADLKLFKRH